MISEGSFPRNVVFFKNSSCSLHLLEIKVLHIHPLFKFTIKFELFTVDPLVKHWNFFVLSNQSARVTSYRIPPLQDSFGSVSISVHEESAQTIHGTELVYVAARFHQHLVQAEFQIPLHHLLERLFELPECKQLHMHPVHRLLTECVSRMHFYRAHVTLINRRRLSMQIVNLNLKIANLSFRFEYFFFKNAHLICGSPYQFLVLRNGCFTEPQFV